MSNIHHQTIESDYGTGKKSLKIYLIGFFLCVVLTLIPFYAVMYETFTRAQNLSSLSFASAVIQFLSSSHLLFTPKHAN